MSDDDRIAGSIGSDDVVGAGFPVPMPTPGQGKRESRITLPKHPDNNQEITVVCITTFANGGVINDLTTEGGKAKSKHEYDTVVDIMKSII